MISNATETSQPSTQARRKKHTTCFEDDESGDGIGDDELIDWDNLEIWADSDGAGTLGHGIAKMLVDDVAFVENRGDLLSAHLNNFLTMRKDR